MKYRCTELNTEDNSLSFDIDYIYFAGMISITEFNVFKLNEDSEWQEIEDKAEKRKIFDLHGMNLFKKILKEKEQDHFDYIKIRS